MKYRFIHRRKHKMFANSKSNSQSNRDSNSNSNKESNGNSESKVDSKPKFKKFCNILKRVTYQSKDISFNVMKKIK